MLARSIPIIAAALTFFTHSVRSDAGSDVIACAQSIYDNTPSVPATTPVNIYPTQTGPLQWQLKYDPTICDSAVLAASWSVANIVLRKTYTGVSTNLAFDPSGSTFLTTTSPDSGTVPAGFYQWTLILISQDMSYSLTYQSTLFQITHNTAAPPSPSGLGRKRQITQDVFAQPGTPSGQCGPRSILCSGATEGSWECVDISSSLEYCGGCPGTVEAVDCSAIPHAYDVACISGQCTVLKCEEDFVPSADAYTCEASN